MRQSRAIECSERLEVVAVRGVPIVAPGDDLAGLATAALAHAAIALRDGDVLVVTSKVVSRSEGRFVDLSRVEVSPRATETARAVGKDPRLVELILRESTHISRSAPNVLI